MRGAAGPDTLRDMISSSGGPASSATPPGRIPASFLTRRRFMAVAAGITGAGVLAACGSSEDGTARDAASELEILTTGGRDLGGVTLNPASQVETNVLPDLIVDDLGRRKKINVRNVFPAERPVLIWMWAPF